MSRSSMAFISDSNRYCALHEKTAAFLAEISAGIPPSPATASSPCHSTGDDGHGHRTAGAPCCTLVTFGAGTRPRSLVALAGRGAPAPFPPADYIFARQERQFFPLGIACFPCCEAG